SCSWCLRFGATVSLMSRLHKNSYTLQSDTAQLQRDNDYLRDSKADLEREVAELRPERDELRRELSSKRVASTELEAVAREKRVLEQHKNTLAVHIDDLESRIEQLTSAQKTQTPFPAMSLMDSERDYRARMDLDEVPDLETFASQLQHRIAKAEKYVELFYPIEDIRVLLGGLAMSQLHVFQGISGTGKTSLAKAFAKAMGGFCTDIAVQAGWRDRDDLLGHYNAFERRFYEKDCLQALYKAQTPRWEDTCNIILLDEMNLSRPEQYFAEFLSALEKNNPDERLISLSETLLSNAPAMLGEGRKIRVPANVWFIGTANHDETTNELADKTYDRAHVMTLPKQDKRFTIKPFEPANYSYRSLRKAFGKARAEHKEEVIKLLKDLTGDAFTEQLGSQFELGWGNRFEKQALDFIPVMLACGASSGEALDHLLATRIMRPGKVTGRYNVSAETLRNLKGALEEFWISADLAGDPRKSMELLEADIRRLDGRS
ncbi:AAA family ATPase, partial [Pseudomonas sp. o96-267]